MIHLRSSSSATLRTKALRNVFGRPREGFTPVHFNQESMDDIHTARLQVGPDISKR
jgi:hypothetical protein